MKKINQWAFLGALWAVINSLNLQAATVGYNLGTDSVFKSAAGTALPLNLEASFGYFSESGATTIFDDAQISALVTVGMTGSQALAALDSKFVSLGTIKFGKYIGSDNTESTTYASFPIADGTFGRAWGALNTKPSTVEMGGLNPYFYVKSGTEFLVVAAIGSSIPTGVGVQLSGGWAINGASATDPETFEVFDPTARVVGSLGSYDAGSNSFSTVPEPSSGALIAASLVVFALKRKRTLS